MNCRWAPWHGALRSRTVWDRSPRWSLPIQPLGSELNPLATSVSPETVPTLCGNRPVSAGTARLWPPPCEQMVTWLLCHDLLEIGEVPHLLCLHGMSAEKLPVGSQITPPG